MAYEFFIALRYLRSKRRTRFVSIITYISVGGVMVGVAALVIVLSLFNGFETEVRSRIIGERAHINVFSLYNNPITNYQALIQEILKLDHVEAASPFILNKAAFKPLPATGGTDAVVVWGIDPDQEKHVTNVHNNVKYGAMDFSMASIPDEESTKTYPGLVIGNALASEMGVALGQKVALINIQGISITSFQPYVRVYRVAGITETGFYEYDRTFVYMDLKEAQRLFKTLKIDGVKGIAVRVDNRDIARDVADKIEVNLNRFEPRAEGGEVSTIRMPAYFTVDWMQQNRGLFRWMTLEKWGSFAILNLIILVAAFNIVSTLIMVVLEKTKDIGILKSMGATSKSMMKIFIIQGSIVGILGTVLGCVVGYALCWAQATFEIIALPADIYLIDALPIQMQVSDFLSVAFGSFVICILATIYPAWQAARLLPVEAIRYE